MVPALPALVEHEVPSDVVTATEAIIEAENSKREAGRQGGREAGRQGGKEGGRERKKKAGTGAANELIKYLVAIFKPVQENGHTTPACVCNTNKY